MAVLLTRKDGKLNLRHGASMKTIAGITRLGSFGFLAPGCKSAGIGGVGQDV